MKAERSAPAEEILIVGTGALACLFAARCAKAGAAVSMLGRWKDALQQLHRTGVCLVIRTTTEIYPVQLAGPSTPNAQARLALVLVKAWQTEAAARRLAPFLAEDGIAVTLQNGLGNLEALAAVLGAERAAAGVTTAAARLLEPGIVLPSGRGAVSLPRQPRLAPLAALLRQAKFKVNFVERTDSLVWGKLVISSAINPLTALLGVPNGELLERPTARELLQNVAVETAAVAGALGIPLPFADPAQAALAVAQETAANRSSMLEDLERRRPTEVDAINGAIVRSAQAAGVPAPLNQALWQLVKARLAAFQRRSER